MIQNAGFIFIFSFALFSLYIRMYLCICICFHLSSVCSISFYGDSSGSFGSVGSLRLSRHIPQRATDRPTSWLCRLITRGGSQDFWVVLLISDLALRAFSLDKLRLKYAPGVGTRKQIPFEN